MARTTKKQKLINKATNRYFTEHENAILFNYADNVRNLTARKAKHLFKEEIKKRVENGQTANKAARDILREQDIEIKVKHLSDRELNIRRSVNKAWAENKERIVNSYKEINPAITEEQAKTYFNMTVRRDLSISNRTPSRATKHILMTNTFMSKQEREHEYEEKLLSGKLSSLKGSYELIKKGLGINPREKFSSKRDEITIKWDPDNKRYTLIRNYTITETTADGTIRKIPMRKEISVYRPDKYKGKKLKVA